MSGSSKRSVVWRRGIAMAMATLFSILLWPAADAPLHRSLHSHLHNHTAHCHHAALGRASSTPATPKAASESPAPFSQEPEDSDCHCVLTLLLQGKVTCTAEAPRVTTFRHIRLVMTAFKETPAPLLSQLERLPFCCGPPAA